MDSAGSRLCYSQEPHLYTGAVDCSHHAQGCQSFESLGCWHYKTEAMKGFKTTLSQLLLFPGCGAFDPDRTIRYGNEFRSGRKRTAGQQRQWCLELETEPWNFRTDPWTGETESIAVYGSVPVPGMYSVVVHAWLLIVSKSMCINRTRFSRRRVQPIRETSRILLALSGQIVRGSRLYCIVSPDYLHTRHTYTYILLLVLWTQIKSQL